LEKEKKMSQSITFLEILNGSQEIERMRKCIKGTVSTMIGVLSSEDLEPYRKVHGKTSRPPIIFQSGSFKWKVRTVTPHRNEGDVWISDVSLVFGEQEQICFDFHLTSSDPSPTLKLDQVESTYKTLQVFVDGMIDTFPSLVGKLAPFVRAAKSLN
jgi:hypothetical protein